jgi:hypothetical protein
MNGLNKISPHPQTALSPCHEEDPHPKDEEPSSDFGISTIGVGDSIPIVGEPNLPDVPPTDGTMFCDKCGGWWHRTNEVGLQWMEKKIKRVETLGWSKRRCLECDGATFSLPNTSGKETHGGRFFDEVGELWIFNGSENFWENDFSEEGNS